MKNQYAGDIGDYTKLGMLRAIERAGFHLGINWYLTPDEHSDSPNKTDGKHTDYLRKLCDTSDRVLFQKLKEIIDSGVRSVEKLETAGLFELARFFGEILVSSQRKGWHAKAISALKEREVVFLDPDNGLEIKSTEPHHKDGNKYTTYEEASDYYVKGRASVIVYNHRDRSPSENYIKRLTKFVDEKWTPGAVSFYLRSHQYSVRDYLFLVQPHHLDKMNQAITRLLSPGTGWDEYFERNHFSM